jgi:glycosyltransferase involved in cell wall biosynthesis
MSSQTSSTLTPGALCSVEPRRSALTARGNDTRRVLAILEGGDRYPSGTIRALIYKDLFAASGFAVDFLPRTPQKDLDFLENPPRLLRRVIHHPRVYARLVARTHARHERRLVELARQADIVYLSKVATYPLVRKLRDATKARMVLDFGDAVWLYNSSPDEFHNVLRTVDAVTTDNVLTQEYVKRFNPNCTVIPDSPQLEKFEARRSLPRNKREGEITLGWVGSAGTAYNLFEIWEALEAVFTRNPNFRLRLVGCGHNPLAWPPFERVRFSTRPNYNQAEMIDEIFGMDIGLYPLQDVERCRVRGILKATVYMSGEAAVVASPVGQNTELIRDGVNGMLASTCQEWIDKIELLARDVALRRKIVQAGLDTVRQNFTTERSFSLLLDVFNGK